MVGTPIVASEVGGLREVLRCPSTSRPLAWLFATRSPDDLAELVEDALTNQERRRQIIDGAYQSALSRFSLDRMVDGFWMSTATSSIQSRTTSGRSLPRPPSQNCFEVGLDSFGVGT